MKNILFCLATICALALSGCSSTPTKVDTGAVHGKTFNFVRNGAVGSARFAENREKIHAMIQESITSNMASKGITRAADVGDLTVAYLVIVGNNASTAAVNDYFGYGRDDAAILDEAHKKFALENKNPNYFAAGTLVIDIIDSKSYKLLKRTYVVKPVLQNPTAEVRKENIQQAVDEALRDLRVE